MLAITVLAKLETNVWSPKSEAQNKDPYRRATYVGSFEASVLVHVALRMLADTLHRWVTLLLLIFILSVWSPNSEVPSQLPYILQQDNFKI